MANTFVASRAHIIWGICLPLAILIGYLLADPVDQGSVAVFILLAAVLSVPLLLRWYHPLLIISWNAAIMPAFLPGAMSLWMALGVVACMFGVLNRAASPKNKFLCPMPVLLSLAFLVGVVLVTMISTGGVGVRSLGSAKYGGRAYFYIAFAIIGFFGLVSQRVPRHRARLFAGLFFFAGITQACSDVIYLIGPKAYPLFSIFPVTNAVSLAAATAGPGGADGARISGFGLAMVAIVSGMLALYGVKGLLDYKRLWRVALVVLAFGVGSLSGFRSTLLLSAGAVAAVFFLEGLHRTRMLFVIFGVAALVGGFLTVFASELPLSVQRTISFLPVDVDPHVRQEAQQSVDWRVDMWRALLPDVPNYWFMGKGYMMDGNTLALGVESMARGLGARWEVAAYAGDYHSGPLSLIIPLGGLGVVAFAGFLFTGWRVLLQNYRHGDPELRTVNRFILGYFLVRIVFFILVFGSFYLDLFVFTGLVGLSLSLNGGMCNRTAARADSTTEIERLTWNDYKSW